MDIAHTIFVLIFFFVVEAGYRYECRFFASIANTNKCASITVQAATNISSDIE
jgi:hypothetical protein